MNSSSLKKDSDALMPYSMTDQCVGSSSQLLLLQSEGGLPTCTVCLSGTQKFRNPTKHLRPWLWAVLMVPGSPLQTLSLSPQTPSLSLIPSPLRVKKKLVNARWILSLSFRDSGLQCQGAAAPISLGHGVLCQLSLPQREAPRVSAAKQLCQPAYGAREGWRELV